MYTDFAVTLYTPAMYILFMFHINLKPYLFDSVHKLVVMFGSIPYI